MQRYSRFLLLLTLILFCAYHFHEVKNIAAAPKDIRPKLFLVFNAFVLQHPRAGISDPLLHSLDTIRWYFERTREIMLDAAEGLYIEVSSTDPTAAASVKGFLWKTVPSHHRDKIFVNVTTRNLNEYPGIFRAYELAHLYPDAVIAYFHSKGVTYPKTDQAYKFAREYFLSFSFEIEDILQMFSVCKSASSAGISCAPNGFVWQTFWYARGKFLQTREAPRVFEGYNDNRYYYEVWLGLTKGCEKQYWPKYGGNASCHSSADTCFSLTNLKLNASGGPGDSYQFRRQPTGFLIRNGQSCEGKLTSTRNKVASRAPHIIGTRPNTE
jgi:hypothetical protein